MKFRVIEEPGVPGPRGFVRAGDVLTLPDDAVPSRSLVPLDEAAVKALTKAKTEYVEDLERRMAELDPPRKLNGQKKRQLLEVPEIPKAKDPDAPEDEDEGQTLREVAFERGQLDDTSPAAAKRAGKRASDQ